MNEIKISISCIFILLTFNTLAQVEEKNSIARKIDYGILIGMNVANMDDENRNEHARYKPGIKVGLVTELSISDIIAIRSGLNYSSKGRIYEREVSTDEPYYFYQYMYEKIKINYLEVPLSLIIKHKILRLNIGIYGAMGLTGDYYYNEITKSSLSNDYFFTRNHEIILQDVVEDYSSSEKYYRKVDMGIEAGIGFNIGFGIINIQYQKGITNMKPSILNRQYYNRDEDPVTNYGFNFSFIYIL